MNLNFEVDGVSSSPKGFTSRFAFWTKIGSQSCHAALPSIWSCCDYTARGGRCVAASLSQGFRPAVSELSPLRNWQTPCRKSRTQVQTCDTSEGTLVTQACNSMREIRTDIREDKTQQDEAACDPVAQVEPCFLDWVGGRGSHKSHLPYVLARQSVYAVWRVVQTCGNCETRASVSINFLIRGKEASCVVSQESLVPL